MDNMKKKKKNVQIRRTAIFDCNCNVFKFLMYLNF